MKMQPSKHWDQKLDIFLVRVVVVAALLVLAAQVFLWSDPFEQNIETALSCDFCAPPYSAATKDFSKPVVTFKLKGFSALPLARVLVNGESAGVFSERYVTVFVGEGDTLEIDGTRYDRPFEIEVLDVGRGVLSPQPGSSITVDGGVSVIGVVRVSK